MLLARLCSLALFRCLHGKDLAIINAESSDFAITIDNLPQIANLISSGN